MIGRRHESRRWPNGTGRAVQMLDAGISVDRVCRRTGLRKPFVAALRHRVLLRAECNLVRLLDDRRGAAAIEYGLIVALIAVAIVTVLGGVGTSLSGAFNCVAGSL